MLFFLYAMPSMVQEVKIHSSPSLEMKVLGKASYLFLQGKLICLAETAVNLAVHTALPHSAEFLFLREYVKNRLVCLHLPSPPF